VIRIGEGLIPLADVPDLAFMPRRRRGRKLHASCVYRWAQRGVRGIKLEVVRVGGTLCTTTQALEQFFQATAGVVATTAPKQVAKQQHLDRVRRELDAARL
jgi:hypothetical protein